MEDITRCLDYWHGLTVENDQAKLENSWPPNLDHGDNLERFIEGHSPDSGDADIRYWLGKAAGAGDKPLGKSLHDQVIKQFRSLYVETHDPELPNLRAWDDLPDDDLKSKDQAILRDLAEIARKHCEELEKITPVMLEAEAVAACRLLEARQFPSDDLDDNVAVYHGKGLYQVDPESILLTGYQADVLHALVELRAASLEQLRTQSGCDNPSATLKSIRERHSLLAPFIRMAGRKNSGGYSTTIRNAVTT